MATEIAGFQTTPQPTDTSAPPTPSLSFSNFRLASADSMSSLSMSYYDSSPILRDFQELTLSLTDDEDDGEQNESICTAMEEDLSLFVFSPNNSNVDTAHDANNIFEFSNNDNNKKNNHDDENDANPFLMGLAINISDILTNCNEDMLPDIECCDDAYDDLYVYTNGNVTDFDELSEAETDSDRRFIMKKYEYICNIGIGAFGIVDKVFEPKNNRYVAIKQSRSIGDEILKQFRNEQLILDEFIDCEYIINLIDYGKNIDANQICLGLEYMDIGSLCNIKSYNMAQIKYICYAVLNALDALHDKFYVHNDVKPENILICSDGSVKLIDFGCTMKLKHVNDKLTKSIGSIRYLSYEKRCCSPIEYNTKSDIYSFGITISEVYNKKHYKKYNKNNKYNHYFMTHSLNPINMHINDPIFSDFIAKTLVKDPQKRYSAKQLLKHEFLRNVAQKVQFQMPLL